MCQFISIENAKIQKFQVFHWNTVLWIYVKVRLRWINLCEPGQENISTTHKIKISLFISWIKPTYHAMHYMFLLLFVLASRSASTSHNLALMCWGNEEEEVGEEIENLKTMNLFYLINLKVLNFQFFLLRVDLDEIKQEASEYLKKPEIHSQN